MVVNPIAGGRDKTSLLAEVKQEIRQRNLDLQLFNTTGENDKENLKKAIRDYKPQRLLSFGGDGTIKLAAEVEPAAP